MQQDITTFPLSPLHRSKLSRAGFLTAADVLELQPLELSEELEVTKEEAFDIIQTIRAGVTQPNSSKTPGANKSAGASVSSTAQDILQREAKLNAIVTFCHDWDEMLGGGVPLTKITEFCGAPGIGKTQLGMQLAVNVQLPREFQGVEGEAIYLDTEGSFIAERALEISKAMVDRLKTIAASRREPILTAAAEKLSPEVVMARIHYFRIRDLCELLAVVQLLPEFCRDHPNVKLVVMDSIAFHFRQDFENMAKRTRMLNGMAQDLLALATEFQLAVVLINQMTTRIAQGSSTSASSFGTTKGHLIPALGESWGHASTIRVIMFWEAGERRAVLYKSPTRQEATISYQVTTGGIRGVISPAKRRLDADHEDLRKRP